MVKIRILRVQHIPYMRVGEIVEVDIVTAVALVHVGEAEYLSQYETEVVEKREKAVLPRPKKR